MSTFSQHDYNREAGQSMRQFLRHAEVATYELTKALILFVKSMVQMFTGR